MFIVDGDTHISNLKTGKRINAEEMLERFEANGIAKSLIWVHPAQTDDEYCDFPEQNKYIYEMAKKYPDRFLPLGWLNPTQYGLDATLEQLKRYVGEYGFLGVKLNGALGKYSITDESIAIPVIEAIAKSGVVLAFHCGSDPNTHPDKVGQIAARYPGTRVLLVHYGREAHENALAAAKANKNIHIVGSHMEDYSYISRGVKEIGADRISFGSDSPFQPLEESLEGYKPELAKMSESDAAMVMGGGLLKFFGK